MMFQIFKKPFSALLLSSLFFLGASTAQAVEQEQFHLLVDVSGSMQRFDPQKQRVAALKQFINEIPDGSQAGIWTYAGQVNMLLAPSTVNAQWRQRADQAVSSISGYGPNANLANAVAQATHHWRNAPARSGRNLIVLTDNGVTLNNAAAQSESAKQQLLNTLIPQLQKSQIRVFALGFPHADKALLQKITSETQGSFQSVESPTAIPTAMSLLETSLATSATPNTVAQITAEPAPAVVQETVPLTAPVDAPLINAPVVPEQAPALNSSADAQIIVAEAEIAAPIQELAQVEASVPLPPPTELGQAESAQIKAQLAEAEAKLQELITEATNKAMAAHAADEGLEAASSTAALTGQQLSEPMVITLDDGSVLVTSDQTKATAFSEETAAVEQAKLASESLPAVTFNEEADVIAEPTALESYAASESDIWPLILSILAVLNVIVIFMLFIGRYFWLRHKRRATDSVYAMN